MNELLKDLISAKAAICKAIEDIENVGWHKLCDGYDYSDDGRVRHKKKGGYKELVLTGRRFYADKRYWYFPKNGVPKQIAKQKKSLAKKLSEKYPLSEREIQDLIIDIREQYHYDIPENILRIHIEQCLSNGIGLSVSDFGNKKDK